MQRSNSISKKIKRCKKITIVFKPLNSKKNQHQQTNKGCLVLCGLYFKPTHPFTFKIADIFEAFGMTQWRLFESWRSKWFGTTKFVRIWRSRSSAYFGIPLLRRTLRVCKMTQLLDSPSVLFYPNLINTFIY